MDSAMCMPTCRVSLARLWGWGGGGGADCYGCTEIRTYGLAPYASSPEVDGVGWVRGCAYGASLRVRGEPVGTDPRKRGARREGTREEEEEREGEGEEERGRGKKKGRGSCSRWWLCCVMLCCVMLCSVV